MKSNLSDLEVASGSQENSPLSLKRREFATVFGLMPTNKPLDNFQKLFGIPSPTKRCDSTQAIRNKLLAQSIVCLTLPDSLHNRRNVFRVTVNSAACGYF